MSFLVAAALSAVMSTQALPPMLKDVHTMVCMGDSITEQGASPTGYVTLIQKALPTIKVINAGISGHKAPDMRARFQRDVMDKNPDLVTISVGVNDVWHGFFDNHTKGDGPNGVPLPKYVADIQAMIDVAKAKNVKVVLVSPTMIYEDSKNLENKKLGDYVQAMKELAHKNACGFADLYHPFLQVVDAYQKRAGKGVNLLTVDGVHMNPAGNQLMAHGILSTLGVRSSS